MQGRILRQGILAVIVLSVAALILPPFINIGRYKSRVTQSMSNALGRPVTVDSVELRLVPQPGFYLENVSVGDDPAYSSEPILHAEEVTAYLRISSLWRGRLEIARLNLKYPSLNLVEREDASWNLESLLWKASRTEAAPTAAGLSASRTRFPYIEASNGRVNFKYGLEKNVFSFTEADFTLFSPAENQWRMRLSARPVRTDMPVTDTGTLKAEVTMQRAPLLRDAPLKATVSWERVQLGNLTRLIYGEDRGWRGALEASAQFAGTPAALHFTTAARLREFRRFDISSGDEANINATCSGELNVSDDILHNTECRVPLEGGVLSARGMLRGLRQPRYDLALTAESLPVNALLNLARRAKRDLPPDLAAQGTIAASFHARRVSDAPSEWVGNLVVSDLVLHSSVLGKDLSVFKAEAMANTIEVSQPRRRGRYSGPAAPSRALVVESFDLPLGAATPATVEGLLDDEHFALHFKGDARLERLQQFARAVGVGVPQIALAGPATLDLTVGANWIDFANPAVTGTAQLKNVRAEVPGLSVPLEISSAHVELERNRFSLRNATATAGKIALAGSASFPRSCTADLPCESTFDLTTDEFNPERWNEVLNPRLKKQPWYRLLGTVGDGNSVIANLHSTGHLSARRLILAANTGTAFETSFSISDGILRLKDTRAEVFGGEVNSDWKIDFTGNEAIFESTGTATRVQAEKLAPLVKANLGSGTIALSYKLKMAGLDAVALAKSTVAQTEFSWNGGVLRISPDAKAPLRVLTGQGKATLDKAGWTIFDSKWKTPSGIYQLSGTASRDAVLALEFTQEDGAIWKVTGTPLKQQLSAPPAPQPTQAASRK
jgi:hypothetical protein